MIDDGCLSSPARAREGARIAARLSRNPMVSRIENPHLDLFYRPDLASAAECAEMRAIIDAGAEPSELFYGNGDPQYRTSYSCHLDPTDPLVVTLSSRIVSLMGVPPENSEVIQGQRYAAGQEYKPHCDWFSDQSDYWPKMRAQGGQRVWTAMIYLNDVEEGGETQFLHLGLMVPPRQGMVLIWNNLGADGAPTNYAYHAALPVVRGQKYVLTKWFRERPWRYDEG